MRRKLISLVLVLCMVVSLMPAYAIADTQPKTQTVEKLNNPFSDVSEKDWYYEQVMYANINGIFAGTGENTFTPMGSMNRGMFVTVLGRMAGVDAEAYRGMDTGFSDVPLDAYYAPYVAWAVKHGIASGVGGGKFAPTQNVKREQVAVFFVRYLEIFDVEYDTGANITTTPMDIDKVSAYAKDAVQKLWKLGILNGDGKNFDPKSDVTRAQTATISMKLDGAVETWYKEEGVPSERVKIEIEVSEDGIIVSEIITPDGTNTSGGTKTQYHKVDFALGNSQPNVTLPASGSYAKNTPITNLPIPSDFGMVFLGWYYDPDLTRSVEIGDVVESDITLYAKVAEGEELNSLETPNYVTVTEQPTNYKFKIFGDGLSEADIENVLSFIQVTVDNPEVEYAVTNNGSGYFTITPELEEGITYKAELTDDDVVFVLDDEKQNTSVRILNILTEKEEVANAALNPRLKQIAKTNTNISDEAFNGLFQINQDGMSVQNVSSGTFSYSGEATFGVGDTLAITEGNVDLTDVRSNEGNVAYVKIVNKEGNDFSYEMAEIEDVLFIPDAFPVPTTADLDAIDNQITIAKTELARIMQEVDANVLDEGDFIGLYNDIGEVGYQEEDVITYGEITSYVISGSNYVITYTPANENDIEDAVDVYYTEDQDISLTNSEQRQIARAIKDEFSQSEYTEQAALYLASLMIETDNLSEAPVPQKISDRLELFQSAPALRSGNAVMRTQGPNTVTLDLDPSKIRVVLRTKWFDNLKGSGLEAIIEVPFKVNINNQITLEFTATFEEEIILKTNIKTEKLGKNPFKFDYRLSTAFEIGSYTGIQFKVNVKTGSQNNKSLTKELDDLMSRMKAYSNTDGVKSTNGDMESLANIYNEIMESANDAWLDIVNVPILDLSGTAFYHIFAYQVKASFVVSANICASIGLSFDFTMQKRYDFTLRVDTEEVTNNTTDIISPVYRFDFYVVGTLGIRAGLRLEMYVGIIDLGLDKIGLQAEVGAYSRLWGYFFYNYTSKKGQKYSGATLVEIGVYLDIKFLAQLLNSSTLSFNPTLYANEWPLLSLGKRENVYAFNVDDNANITMTNITDISLPKETFTMKYMDLKNGDIGTVEKDDSSESNFNIAFSNPIFSYAPDTNTITVDKERVENLVEETDMIISWRPQAMAFSSMPLRKAIHISYTSPADYRAITFDSRGGTNVTAIVKKVGENITWPQDPTKRGYIFDGWYEEPEYSTQYTPISTMPDLGGEDRGIIIYAKWKPAENTTYNVLHYKEGLDGRYQVAERESFEGKTDSMTSITPKPYEGFTPQAITQKQIRPDGTTTIEVYYTRNTYRLEFNMDGDGRDSEGNPYLTNVLHDRFGVYFKYGEEIIPSALKRPGYTLTGWNPEMPATMGAINDIVYNAIYTPNENKVLLGGDEYDYRIVKTGQKMTEPSAMRVGYTIDGWYKDASLVIPWNFETDKVVGPMSIYPKWDTVIYFESNGGTSVPNASVSQGFLIQKPADPTKTNYVFCGWFEDDGTFNNEWNFDTDKVKKPITLYAKWEKASYTVEFDTKGGTIVSDSQVTHGELVTKPADPTRENSIFAGWYKDSSYAVPWDFGVDTVTAPTTLHAKWTAEAGNCVVTFDNGGRGEAPASMTLSQDDTIPTAPVIEDEYFEIAGWYRDPGLSYNEWIFEDDEDPSSQTSRIMASDGEAITLYPKWVEKAGLWVGDIKIDTIENLPQVLTGENSGTIYYDRTTNTVRLDDVNIAAEMENGIGIIQYISNVAAENYANTALTINVTGTNTITNTYRGIGAASDEIYGIRTNTNLRFIGDGTLTVKTGHSITEQDGNNIAIYCAINQHKHMYEYPTLSILGPKVNAEAGVGENSYGIELLGYYKNTSNCNIMYGSGTLNASGHTQGMNVENVYDLDVYDEEGVNTAMSIMGTDTYGNEPNVSFAGEGTNMSIYESVAIKNAQRTILFFNTAGGDKLPIEYMLLVCDGSATYGELPVPTRSGYTFLRWYEDYRRTTIASDTIVTELDRNMIFAEWKKN